MKRIALLLLIALVAGSIASARKAHEYTLTLTVVRAQSRRYLDNSDNSSNSSTDCKKSTKGDAVNCDTYTNGPISIPVTEYTISVVASDGNDYVIRCNNRPLFSHCQNLPLGSKLRARWNKSDLVVEYVADDKAKEIDYAVVSATEHAAAVNSSSSPPAAATSAVSAPTASSAPPEQLNVSSTPAGADIDVDGAYVGSTPSSLSLAPGDHLIEIKKDGFTGWSRKMHVFGGGSVNVSATLQSAGH
jgi:hypothetical protein